MKRFNILDFGAKADGKTENTRHIQEAIDQCEYGDEVVIPRGIFVSGALFVHGGVKLLLENGAVLKGSSSLEDYPPYTYRFEGQEHSAYASLINVADGEHEGIEISGNGIIDGSGMYLYKKEYADNDFYRGRVICIRNTSNCVVSGITICDSAAWTLQFIYCSNVKVTGIKIFAKKTYDDERTNRSLKNGDGIVIDSCSDVEIDNCIIDSQDDCISIKSGKNKEGRDVNIPTSRLRIHDNYFIGGAGIAIGSEMSGGIEDILIQKCTYVNVLSMLSIKSNIERGGQIRYVRVQDCSLINHNMSIPIKAGYKAAIFFDECYRPPTGDDIEPEYPIISNIAFINIHIFNKWGNLFYIRGIKACPMKNILFKNVEAFAVQKGEISGAEVIFENVYNNGIPIG